MLTAAHCINYTTLLSSQCPYSYSVSCRNPNCPKSDEIGFSKVLNFGTVYPGVTECANNVASGVNGPAGSNVADYSGDNDVALVLLKTPVPTSLVPHVASIASQLPSPGQTVSGFGVGSTAPQVDPDYQLRYADWKYTDTSSSLGAQYTDPAAFAVGDSGGPDIFGSGATDDGNDQVWGVNSYIAAGLHTGAVVFLRPKICAAMYSEQPHTWGLPGAPLIVPVSGCQSSQSPQDAATDTDAVISSVCASHPTCCGDPTGYWDSSCVTAGYQAYNTKNYPNGCFAAGTGNAWTFDHIGTTEQWYPRDFGMFALQGDVSSIPDSDDAVAAQGNVVLGGFSINTLQEPVGLVAGGSVNLSNGTVFGNIYYGGPTGSQSIPSTVTRKPSTATVTQGNPIRFAEARSALQTMSTTLSQAPNQIVVAPSSGGNLVLSSSSAGLNVFLIHQADLQNTHSITLQVPFSSTVIINVDGTAPTIANSGMDVRGHDPGLILWNFYQAGSDPANSKLVIRSVVFYGSILAPLADSQFVSGAMAGTLVAKSLQDNWVEFHHHPFRNNCLVPN